MQQSTFARFVGPTGARTVNPNYSQRRLIWLASVDQAVELLYGFDV
jgi:hypothetical protein